MGGVLLHHSNLLSTEIIGLLYEVTAYDKKQLTVGLQKLDFSCVDLAVLLELARSWITVGVWGKRSQVHSLVRAGQLKYTK